MIPRPRPPRIVSILVLLMVITPLLPQAGLAQLAREKASQRVPGPFRFVGFWLSPTRSYRWDAREKTYRPMIDAWRSTGANGVLITDRDLPGIREKLEFSRAYRQRFLGGFEFTRPYEVARMLEDPVVSRYCDGLYLDEIAWTWTYDPGIPLPFTPFDPGRHRMCFDSLLTLCEKHHKAMAVTAYSLNGIPQFDSMYAAVKRYDDEHRHPRTGRLTTSRVKNLFIFFSGSYLDRGKNGYLTNLDAVVRWAKAHAFPMRQVIMWLSPSCTYPRMDGGTHVVPDCEPSWTLDQILRAGRLGFGGVYFYLGNGVDEKHLEQVYCGLWATGMRRVSGVPRPATHGALRTAMQNTAKREALQRELKRSRVPTYTGSWNWE